MKRGAGPAEPYGARPLAVDVEPRRLKEMLTYPETWGPSEWGARWPGCVQGGQGTGAAQCAMHCVAPACSVPPAVHHTAQLPPPSPRLPGPIPFLPDNDILVRRLEAQWGELGGYRGLATSGRGAAVVSGIQLGNVWVGVQVRRGGWERCSRHRRSREAAGQRTKVGSLGLQARAPPACS